ncbi:MAG: hydroxyisourate hydrolase [Pseudomonadota bacterium]
MHVSITSHVLNLDTGRPVQGMSVALLSGGDELAAAETDADGRLSPWQLTDVSADHPYSLVFATDTWFSQQGSSCFYPEVCITVRFNEPGHYHIPLLLNRHGYSTYRGS